MTFNQLVETSPRLTSDRLNNEACLALAEFILRDIRHDIDTTVSTLKDHSKEHSTIVRALDMLELLQSDYMEGLTFGHASEVVEDYIMKTEKILGYDIRKAIDIIPILNNIAYKMQKERCHIKDYNVVIRSLDLFSGKSKLVFPEHSTTVISDTSNVHMYKVYNVSGYDFLIYGNYYKTDISNRFGKYRHMYYTAPNGEELLVSFCVIHSTEDAKIDNDIYRSVKRERKNSRAKQAI